MIIIDDSMVVVKHEKQHKNVVELSSSSSSWSQYDDDYDENLTVSISLTPSDNCATGHSVDQPGSGQYCYNVV